VEEGCKGVVDLVVPVAAIILAQQQEDANLSANLPQALLIRSPVRGRPGRVMGLEAPVKNGFEPQTTGGGWLPSDAVVHALTATGQNTELCVANNVPRSQWEPWQVNQWLTRASRIHLSSMLRMFCTLNLHYSQ